MISLRINVVLIYFDRNKIRASCFKIPFTILHDSLTNRDSLMPKEDFPRILVFLFYSLKSILRDKKFPSLISAPRCAVEKLKRGNYRGREKNKNV